ncbi:hypothetical protein KP13_32062 (plasmid) [Klebsiella pneumoniae subsp. pneumoniae Kp13]|nr:hypothetical protein KP13_32062 [Klebsiella pneumoniae subsp. pneumoniae Kp13]
MFGIDFARCKQEPIDEERDRVERRQFSLCIRSYIWPTLTSSTDARFIAIKSNFVKQPHQICSGNPLLITGRTILQSQRIIFRN